jgi:glycerol-3-phosphate O-acyltransferase
MNQKTETGKNKNTDSLSPILLRTARGVRNFLSRTFTQVVIDGPALDQNKIAEMSVMPVCTHRSQADYFILGSTLHDLGFRRVRYAAGDNLTQLPYLGPRFTKLGAFPVSRSMVMNRSYLRNLCFQVTDMMTAGDNPVVFPEGGRSYGGEMMDLKGGLIGSCLVAQWRNPDRNFHFFPASISYEKLPELPYFSMLEKGKKIRALKKGQINRFLGNYYYFGADLFAFAKLLLITRFNVKYGNVYIDYLNPIPVKDMLDVKALYSNKRDDFSSLRTAIQIAGAQIRGHLLSLYRILPEHVLSFILHTSSCTSRREAAGRISHILSSLEKQNRNIKSLAQLSPEQIVDSGIKQLAGFRAVSCVNDKLLIRNRQVIKYHAASITI